MPTNRRNFLKHLPLAISPAILPLHFNSNKLFYKKQRSSIKFGIVADPHADLIPDKNERLEKFIVKAIENKPDFIIQLGDFCFPKKSNLVFLKIWQQYKDPKHNVLGNHDMDVCSKKEIMDFLEMPNKYYSFDQNGFHFVILDANYLFTENKYVDYDNANFYVNDAMRTYINDEQIEWLKNDLKNTDLPTIIFSHQSLINPISGIKNRFEIQELLEKENERAGFQKIIACFNGHDHIDFCRKLNGIYYVEINSMSYQWIGEKYSNKTRYPAAYYETWKHLDKMATYKDALFSFVEINTENNFIKIEGVQSDWLPPSPEELNVPGQVYGNLYSAEIADRELFF